MSDFVRIDKWLWAARFYKTRSLATGAVDDGKVLLGKDRGERVKPAQKLHVGDVVHIEQDGNPREITVLGLSETRGSAPVAQALYEESAASLARRAKLAEERRWFREPTAILKGRPTKRDRRLIDKTSS